MTSLPDPIWPVVVLAVAAHVRARDFGRTLFVNATFMLLICTATLLSSFVL